MWPNDNPISRISIKTKLSIYYQIGVWINEKKNYPWYLILRLLPLPIFIGIYLFSYWRCRKNIAASDKQLKPCIDWAYLKNLPLPPKPSFVEFYIVYVSSFFKFPFGIIIQQLPFSKKVRFYEREMKSIFDKWNLEKIKIQ